MRYNVEVTGARLQTEGQGALLHARPGRPPGYGAWWPTKRTVDAKRHSTALEPSESDHVAVRAGRRSMRRQ